jgi:centromere protein J
MKASFEEGSNQIKLNKAIVSKTKVKENIFTEQIISRKESSSLTNSRLENDYSYVKSNKFMEEENNETQQVSNECGEEQDEHEYINIDIKEVQEEEDDDDDRDIMGIYKLKNISQNQEANNNHFSTISYNQNNSMQQQAYKKPEQSKIINKYFKPLIKEENNKPNYKSQSEADLNKTQGDNELQEILKAKVSELQKEIDKLQSERDKTEKLKKELTNLKNKLQREVQLFQENKEKDTQEFEVYKEKEMKKIERERKAYVNNTKLLQDLPTKKEREEIEQLKEQVIKLQEEMKARDNRNKLAMERTKKQLEDSNKKNEELQKELKLMEELRVKNLLTNGTSSSKSKPKVNTTSANTVGNNINSSINVNNINTSYNNQTLNSNKSSKNLLSGANTIKKDNRDMPFSPNIPQSKRPPVNINVSRKGLNDVGADSDSDSDNNSNNYINNYSIKDSSKQLIHNSHHSTERRENYETNIEKIQINKNVKANISKTPISSEQASIRSDKIIKETGVLKIAKPSEQERKKETISKPEKATIKQDDEEEEDYQLIFPAQYHGKLVKNNRLEKQEITEDGKIIRLYENGKREVDFSSGVRKEIFEDGYQITYFANKDIKQIFPNQKEVYLFSESNTLQFKYPDGLQVFKFDNNQIEKHYPDGTKQVIYSDGTIRYIIPDGYEEIFYSDGSLQRNYNNGVTSIDYEDGIKVTQNINPQDTIYPDGIKTREFPDGRVKKIFPDGTIENSNTK